MSVRNTSIEDKILVEEIEEKTVGGGIKINSAVTFLGSLTFGDTILDSLILNGRLSTSTVAGAALDITASYTYSELMEIRSDVSSWTGVGSSYSGLYMRTSASLGGSYSLHGIQILAAMNTSTTTGLTLLMPGYFECLVKASASNRTLTNARSIEANISIENQTGTLTLTNDIHCLYAKAQTGTGIADYTKVCGIKIGGRDDGTPRVFGKALDISDPEATVCTWTTAINISTSATTGISVNTGTFTTAISVAGTVTTGLAIGTSETNLTLATYASKAVAIYTTCASADAGNSVEPFYMKSTMTGIGGVGGRAKFVMATNVALGWSHALKAIVEYGASGKTTGLGSAFSAEIVLSTGTTSGTYGVMEAKLVADSAVSTGSETSFIYCNIAGSNSTGKTTLNTNAYLIHLGTGVVDTASGLFDTFSEITPKANASLRILIGTTPYYIPISNQADFAE